LRHSEPDANSYRDGNSHSHSDCYGDAHGHGDSDYYGYAERNANTVGDPPAAYAEAAAHAVPAADAVGRAP
jgi:hypothetical protein